MTSFSFYCTIALQERCPVLPVYRCTVIYFLSQPHTCHTFMLIIAKIMVLVLKVPLLNHFRSQTNSLFHLPQGDNDIIINNNNTITTNNTERVSDMYIQLPIFPHRAQNLLNSPYIFEHLQSAHHFVVGMFHPQSGLQQSSQNRYRLYTAHCLYLVFAGQPDGQLCRTRYKV